MPYVFQKLFLKFIPKVCNILYFCNSYLTQLAKNIRIQKNPIRNRPENQSRLLY